MPRLPVLSGGAVIRALERAGFTRIGSRGSHVKMKKVAQERTYITIVPAHRELARKTLRSILRQAGLTVEELEQLL